MRKKIFGRLVVAALLTASGYTFAETGQKILEQRCVECHSLSGPSPATLGQLWLRKGPDLYYAGNKYKADWMMNWLQKPTRIRPAGMFYGDHIMGTDEGDVIDKSTEAAHLVLNQREATVVTEALMALKAKSELVKAGAYKKGDISKSMGEMMFDKFRGCIACHQIEPGYGGLSGPEVYTAAKRLQEDYMISFMQNPKAWDPKIFMPSKYIRDNDLQKFVHYFHELAEESFEDD